MIRDAVAVRFQLLPEVVDLSYVLTFSGLGGLPASMLAPALRFEADRRLIILYVGAPVLSAVVLSNGGSILLIWAVIRSRSPAG